jgi:secondary thiamine-phosphate synthase enzyme
MILHQEHVSVATRGQGLYEITEQIARIVKTSGAKQGTCTVFVRHTSASLLIQENAAADVKTDLLAFFARIAPESGSYAHDDEGPDDMPAHIRSAITRTNEVVPIEAGRLALGTWQGIYLAEHRRAPHTRDVLVVVMGA